jgi:uncharacterized protein with von Willebrand factor type A (vWA) domain
VIDILSGFVEELRSAGVAVGITEHVDAMRAVDAVSLSERAIVRRALGSTLAKSRAEWVTFETVFDAYFAVDSHDPDADDAFARRVERVVAQGDGAVLRAAAREAVRRHAALGTPRAGFITTCSARSAASTSRPFPNGPSPWWPPPRAAAAMPAS